MLKKLFPILLSIYVVNSSASFDGLISHHQQIVDQINSQNIGWTASTDFVKDKSSVYLQKLASTSFEGLNQFPEKHMGGIQDYLELPTNFDTREQWPQCTHDILNQGNCGSCWAFGVTEALSVRVCIAYQNYKVTLSPQQLVSCDHNIAYGCQGGSVYNAYLFAQSDGIPSIDCVPYVSGNTGQATQCATQCQNGQQWYSFKAKNVQNLPTTESILTDLLQYGPVTCGLTVYEDFYYYKEGIYHYQYGKKVGGHAIKVVGWGQQGEVKYWIIVNSWGLDWGMNGTAYIEFGQVGMGIGCVSAQFLI